MTPEHYLDALLKLPVCRAARISPDGHWVAWTWLNVGPAGDVYIAPTDGSSAPIRLTETQDDTFTVSWTADSRAVIVAQDHDGDERVRLYRVDVEQPGTMHPLTEPDPQYYLHGGTLHPNGRWLVYSANYDFAAGKEIEASWIYRHDLESGERRVLARPERAAYWAPQLNSQGTQVLYHRQDRHPAGSQVWLVDIEGNDDREILNAGADVKVEASWLPDGTQTIALTDAGDHRRISIWSLEHGTERTLLDDPRRNIEDVYVPYRSTQAVVLAYEGARCHPSLLEVNSGQETVLKAEAGDLVPLGPVSGGNWVGLYGNSRQPTDLVHFNPGDPKPEAQISLTRVWERTPLRAEDLAQAEDFRWHSVDGLEIQGWLYQPAGTPRGTVVCVHGGPTGHSRDDVDQEVQFFVSQGFTVLDPNYRGSTGFGRRYQEAIKEDGWGGREQDDIRTGIEALIAAGIAEPGKVGITGTSYGGYSSWCAITRFPRETIAAAAPICGMTDLVVDYETTRPDLRPYSEEMLGGRPDQVPERYYERSPIHYVQNISGRLLIVQGMQDPNVTPENVAVVRKELDRAGVTYDVLTFEDEGHGIGRPGNLQTLYRRLAAFFDAAFTDAASR